MDNGTVVALVWAWLAQHPEHYCSYVNPFTQLRWSPTEKRMLAVRVGGHWRRLAQWARVVPALNCVCKFERMVTPRYMSTPPETRRERWTRDGDFIPRQYRVFVWA